MSQITVFCHRCARQVPSQQLVDGLCHECQARSAVEDLGIELRRLQLKISRYQRRGLDTSRSQVQVKRLYERMAGRIIRIVGDHEVAERLFEETVRQAEAGNPKGIILPY